MWSPPQTFFGMSRNAPPKKICSQPEQVSLETGGGGGVGGGGERGESVAWHPKNGNRGDYTSTGFPFNDHGLSRMGLTS